MGENKEFERQYLKGELEVELTPQVKLKPTLESRAGIVKANCPTRAPWLSG